MVPTQNEPGAAMHDQQGSKQISQAGRPVGSTRPTRPDGVADDHGGERVAEWTEHDERDAIETERDLAGWAGAR